MSDFKSKTVEAWKAINEARAKVDAAEAEKRELTADEQVAIDRAIEDGTALLKEADREQRKAKLESAAGALAQATNRPEFGDDEESKDFQSKLASKDYAADFKSYLKGQAPTSLMHEVKVQNETTDSAGGYVVPPEFLARLVEKIISFTPMLGLCTVIDIDTNVVEIPKEGANGSAAWTAESGAFNESDEAFGTMTITAHKATRIVKASEELLADSFFDLDSYLSGRMGRSIGLLLNTALTTGTGSAQPYGVVTRIGASQVVQDSTGNTTKFSGPDHLMNVKHKVPVQYRNANTRWVFTDATSKQAAILKDSQNRYLWNPDLVTGQPGALLGHPVVINPDVAEMAANAKSVVFGDFSFHWVVRRPAITVQRLNELYAANGQVGFRVFARFGADLTITDAPLAVGQNSAT